MDDRARLYYQGLYEYPPRRPMSLRQRVMLALGRPDRHPRGAQLPGDLRLAEEIRAAIERAERAQLADRGLRLREDAKSLLLLNGEHMIAAAILATGRTPPEEILKDVERDITQVLAAVELDHGDDEVSGYDVVDALSRRRRELRTSRLSVWDT